MKILQVLFKLVKKFLNEMIECKDFLISDYLKSFLVDAELDNSKKVDFLVKNNKYCVL
jgi:hypothetical protein